VLHFHRARASFYILIALATAMTALPSKFEEFLKKIRPTEQKEDYIDGHETLREHLQNSDKVEDIYITDFLQGSYRRWTAVKPQEDEKSDVDVVFVTELDNDMEAKEALSKCEPFLDEHYEDKWSPNAHSYEIEEDLVELDLVLTSVPSEETRETLEDLGSMDIGSVLNSGNSAELSETLDLSADSDEDEWRDEPLNIPNRDDNKWVSTHPLETIAFTLEKNSATDGHYVNVVKALKWWRRTKTPTVEGPTSYPFEHIIGDCCPDDVDTVAEGVTRTLENIANRYRVQADNEDVPYLQARGLPADPENNVLKHYTGGEFSAFHSEVDDAATQAREALDEQSKSESRELWHELFGDMFPEYHGNDDSDNDGEKASSIGSKSRVNNASNHQFG
jgi:hypothetical protein